MSMFPPPTLLKELCLAMIFKKREERKKYKKIRDLRAEYRLRKFSF